MTVNIKVIITINIDNQEDEISFFCWAVLILIEKFIKDLPVRKPSFKKGDFKTD